MTSFVARCAIAAPRAAAYAWHARPGAFERLTPPKDAVRLVEDSGGIEDGARKVLAIGPLGIRWTAVHDQHVAGHRFRDVQQRGPFRRFEHTHTFLDDGPANSILVDAIEYELPVGKLGELVAGRAIRAKLEAMFAHRHRVTRHDVELAAREPPGTTSLWIDGRDAESRRVQVVWAFLSTLGWRAVRSTRGAERDAFDAIVRVQPDSAVIEGAGGRESASLSDLADSSLAELHRTLRRFEAAAR